MTRINLTFKVAISTTKYFIEGTMRNGVNAMNLHRSLVRQKLFMLLRWKPSWLLKCLKFGLYLRH